MPAARTAAIIFSLVSTFLCALAPVAHAEESSDYFIDPSDPTLIRRARIPFESQVVLSAADLPQKSAVHAPVLFSGQKFSYLALSPDGNRLAFSVDGDNHDWTGLLDLTDGSVRQLTLNFDALAATPHWSTDGRFLAVEGEVGSERKRVTLVALEQGKECVLDGAALRNKFLNVSDPWWSEKGDKIYFKAEVNNAFRRSLGLKPMGAPAKIGEADLQCRRAALHPVSEFLAEYPTEILPGRLSAIGLTEQPVP